MKRTRKSDAADTKVGSMSSVLGHRGLGALYRALLPLPADPHSSPVPAEEGRQEGGERESS